MLEGLKIRYTPLRVTQPRAHKTVKPLALTRAATRMSVPVKAERRRRKNKREKASRRRTRTMSLYGDQHERNFVRNLVALIYL